MRKTQVEPAAKSVGVWLRVSTEDQVKGESLEHHERRARAYAEARGWRIAEIYRLDAVSGKSVLGDARTQKMLSDVKSGRIEGLVFSKLARLARNTRELLEIAEFFKTNDADLISLQEAIDTSTPAGRLFFTMIAAMAQWEREEISERVAASVPVRAKMGKPTGGQAPFGYRWNGNKQLEPDPKEAPLRALMYELFLEHRRKKTVARVLNDQGHRTRNGSKFSDTTIERLIRDQTAKGIRRANYTRTADSKKAWAFKPESEWVHVSVPPIVSEEAWDQCNRILDGGKAGRKPARRPVHLFAGITRCGCGGKMYILSKSPRYTCRDCRNKIGAADLEAVFSAQLKTFLVAPGEVASYFGRIDETVREKERLVETTAGELKRVASEIDALFALYQAGQIPKNEFGGRYNPMSERRKELENELPRLQADVDVLKVNALSGDEVLNEAQDLTNRWDELPLEEKKTIVENITDQIVVGKEEVEIHLLHLPFLPNRENMATQAQGFIAETSCTREG